VELGSEEEPHFMQEVQAGRSLVRITISDREEEAAALLRDQGALEGAMSSTVSGPLDQVMGGLAEAFVAAASGGCVMALTLSNA
jgi:hypothetical protein